MRVRFGAGETRYLADELDDLGWHRAMVICSPGRADLGHKIADTLGPRCAGVLAEAAEHVPTGVVEHAVAEIDALGADSCVAVGGGSAIGLAKAVALARGTPIAAVPTTFAGSEMTPVWGTTTGGHKTTGRDPRVLPRSVVYDPELVAGLPVPVAVTSGMNAMAHAVEALYAPDATPIVSLMAEEGIRALSGALPRIVHDPGDPDGRSDALYGAWLCGACLGATSMSLHHKLCHVLGGTLGLPHAPTHAVVLPHVLAFNLVAVPEQAAIVAQALGGGADPAMSLWEFAAHVQAPRSLQSLGMDEGDIDRVAVEVTAASYGNPRPTTVDHIRGLLRAAWAGAPPQS